jgi:hypothetical protein
VIVTAAERALYLYAISCALSALVGYAGKRGRGWYHFSDGEVIIATDVAL